jgi:hypothetical protein
VWSIGGFAAAVAVGLIAVLRSRSRGGFYDADVYGMTPRTHRTYAALAAAFALAFLASLALGRERAAVWILAAFVPFALFYLTSFLRGAHEDDDE